MGRLSVVGLRWFCVSIALACGAAEPPEDALMDGDVLDLGAAEQALTNQVPEFPFTVLPVKFVYGGTFCLQVQDANSARDADVGAGICSSSKEHQDWFLIRLKDNSYQIRPGHAGGRLLSIRNAATGNLTNAGQTYDIVTAANARWDIIKKTDGSYRLKNINSQLCLDIAGNQGSCDASEAAFQMIPKYGFPFSITAKHSGKCLNVAGASSANNANVQQYPCVGAENERWWLTPDVATNPTQFEFKAAHSGKCLDIAGGSIANNGNAQQYDCIGVANERWLVQSAGDGYFYIKNANSGKCLTVAGASTSTNANVDQFTCVSADNQKWRWNYFVEKHVQWVNAKNASGTGTDITSTQFTNNFNVARDLFAPYGVSLVHSASSDRAQVNAAAHHFNRDGGGSATWCPHHATTHLPFDCGTMISEEYPDKVVVITGLDASASGDYPFAFLIGNGYGDQCSAPADICGSSNDNVVHMAHELGHFFGNMHTFGVSDGDDWLSDTASDHPGGTCLARTSNPPAVGNNVMSYYVPCTPEISPAQGAILKTAAYARYSDGVR